METPPETHQGQDSPNETRSVLAARLQESAAVAARRLRTQPVITTTWSLPARVFPQAILVMAACLVSGSDVQLRSIQLDIPITGINGYQSSLNALLEQSSIMGRNAFDKAEIGMGKLGGIVASAQNKVVPFFHMPLSKPVSTVTHTESQQINNIMYYIGRGPDASKALQEEVKAFQKEADCLLQQTNEIDTPFEEWSDFTDLLRKHLSNRLGVEVKGDRELSVAEDDFEKANHELEQAEAYYKEQQESLKTYIRSEIPKAASPDDFFKGLAKILKAENKKWPGLSNLARLLWEGSKTDDEAFDERLAKLMKNLSETMQITASESSSERDFLQKRMQAARESVKRAEDALSAARQKRALALKHLTCLENAHSNARKNLELLREHEIDLKVLWDSTQQLRILRSQIGQLSIFFKELSEVVESTVSEYFGSFQRSIEMGQPLNTQEAARYNNLDKQRLLDHVYEIHGRLCTVSNISNVYKYISTNYIRSGLDRIETLSRTDIELYKRQQRELELWCGSATTEIEELAKTFHPLQSSEKIVADLETTIKVVLSKAIDQSHFWAL
ncbi:hypothetical protein ATEIFO6365_0016013600 [Aspergillus terreus]|uniref:Uncharacterized protein n=1 Tax=Aspergillus terreus TaxID=33178 RepID=A0A5M3ZF30_ASPTE|nr:hypothetical protein ATETN484_0017014100 [Aspergillus terreus]GFF21812.1 hypothetical protein ATEIFO6365_0016013600 [Aspergillus terreus]